MNKNTWNKVVLGVAVLVSLSGVKASAAGTQKECVAHPIHEQGAWPIRCSDAVPWLSAACFNNYAGLGEYLASWNIVYCNEKTNADGSTFIEGDFYGICETCVSIDVRDQPQSTFSTDPTPTEPD